MLVPSSSCLSVSVPYVIVPGTACFTVSVFDVAVPGSSCSSVPIYAPCLLERGSSWSMTMPLLASLVMEKRQVG